MSGVLRKRKDGSVGALGKGLVPGALLSPLVTLKAGVTQLPPLLAVPFLPLELGYNPIFRNGKLTPAAKPRQTYTDLQC